MILFHLLSIGIGSSVGHSLDGLINLLEPVLRINMWSRLGCLPWWVSSATHLVHDLCSAKSYLTAIIQLGTTSTTLFYRSNVFIPINIRTQFWRLWFQLKTNGRMTDLSPSEIYSFIVTKTRKNLCFLSKPSDTNETLALQAVQFWRPSSNLGSYLQKLEEVDLLEKFGRLWDSRSVGFSFRTHRLLSNISAPIPSVNTALLNRLAAQ